jgi:hypothetical protein
MDRLGSSCRRRKRPVEGAGGADRKIDIVLTKSEIDAISIRIDGIDAPGCQPGEESPWLFETSVITTHRASGKGGGDFLIFSLVTH